MTYLLCHVNKNGNLCEYRVPTCGFKICRDIFLLPFRLSKGCYNNWLRDALKNRTVVFVDHGLTGRISNNTRPDAHAATRRFIKGVDDSGGTVLPVVVPCNQLRVQDMSSLTKNVVVLPPCCAKRYLYHMYFDFDTENVQSVLENVFINDGQRCPTYKGKVANKGTFFISVLRFAIRSTMFRTAVSTTGPNNGKNIWMMLLQRDLCIESLCVLPKV